MTDIEQLYTDIRTRRAEIRHQRAVLDREDEELAVTERQVARFLPSRPMLDPPTSPVGASRPPPNPIPRPVPPEVLAAKLAETLAPKPTRAKRKPKGVPTILRMARDVLRESSARGERWLEAQDITEVIRKRWWPEVEQSYVQPQLWRAAQKQKVLLKDGSRYALPTENEKGPALSNAEPSRSNGAEAIA
jgi:hypothetical protein